MSTKSVSLEVKQNNKSTHPLLPTVPYHTHASALLMQCIWPRIMQALVRCPEATTVGISDNHFEKKLKLKYEELISLTDAQENMTHSTVIASDKRWKYFLKKQQNKLLAKGPSKLHTHAHPSVTMARGTHPLAKWRLLTSAHVAVATVASFHRRVSLHGLGTHSGHRSDNNAYHNLNQTNTQRYMPPDNCSKHTRTPTHTV